MKKSTIPHFIGKSQHYVNIMSKLSQKVNNFAISSVFDREKTKISSFSPEKKYLKIIIIII